ncbi:MAG TPA: hypothetical protein VFL91_25855 [Thermomicrobiales bacterium]|nr:hypothetical protein [Thermomicrobiales bacterium]
MGYRRNDERDAAFRQGYSYQPLRPPGRKNQDDEAPDEEAEDVAELEHDEVADADEGEGEAQPSEFWPAAELLKGATIEDAELELSYEASVYVDLPAAELRFWLRLPDGTRRYVQIDEPHAVWLYREDAATAGQFEDYPDQRFDLPCTDLRGLRARHRRELTDRQRALHNEIVAVGEALEELDRESREDEDATAGWPGTQWP